MIFNIFGVSGAPGAGNLVFNGEMLSAKSGSDWETALLSSGTLTVRASVLVDLALVAGGMPGQTGKNGKGGYGGAGGEVVLLTGIRLKAGVTYTVSIGSSGEDTGIVGSDGTSYTARSGAGAQGGVPSSSRGTAPTPGGDGSLIWDGESLIDELRNVKFGPGGGAGGYRSADYAYYPGSNGGADGGGKGGDISTSGTSNAGSGTAKRGSGGGGAWRRDGDSAGDGNKGLGGSGIFRIRNHKEAAA